MSTDELGYKVHITDTNGLRLKELTISELNGLDALVTPAWIYSQKSGEVSWANAEAKTLYFKTAEDGADRSGSGAGSAESSKVTMSLYAKVEEDLCTVHIIGPKWLLLSDVIADVIEADDTEIVRLVVSPINIYNTKSILFQQVSLNEINFGETIEVNAKDTPMDIVMKMLDMLSAGINVPAVHAKLIKEVINEGADVNQPLLFTKSFKRLVPAQQNKMIHVENMLGISHPSPLFPKLPSLLKPGSSRSSREGAPARLADTYFPQSNLRCFDFVPVIRWNEGELPRDAGIEEFDAGRYEEACRGNILTKLGFVMIENCGLVEELQLDPDRLVAFLTKIEAGYCLGRPYHNNRHASSVLVSMYTLLFRYGIAESLELQGHDRALFLLASLVAAIIHDYQHQGLSNNCLIETSSPLAIIYNDISPQEQHHSASAFHLISKEEFNFLDKLDKDSMKFFRSNVISLVLHTDMHKHFALMTKIKHATDHNDLQVLQLALKCADLCHVTYAFDLHQVWVRALEEEMFRQGDLEKEVGIPISPMCDRTKPGITISQCEFFDFIAIDLFKQMSLLFPRSAPMYEGLMRNHRRWGELLKAS